MIIFIGDKPSNKMKSGAKPFEGAACEKRVKAWIHEILGESKDYRIFNTTDFDLYAYMCISIQIENGYTFIALGNNAAKMLRECDFEHFKLPHPSGKNRQINDKDFIVSKLNECKEFLEKQRSPRQY